MFSLTRATEDAARLRSIPRALIAGLALAAVIVTGGLIATPGSASATDITIKTVATDNSDGDHNVPTTGTIKDVVNYTGLTPGQTYVLHTQLYNKTDGVMLPYSKATFFRPTAANGSVTVLIPVPAGMDGKTLVVYETIWKSADVQVSKDLTKVTPLPGRTEIISERNPNNTDQTVTIGTPPVDPTKCQVSGHVWQDADRDKVRDAGEAPVANLTVDLRKVASDGSFPGTLLQTTKTDANGYYSFTIIDVRNCSNFFVDFNEREIPSGWFPISGGDSDLQPGNEHTGWTGAYTVPGGGSQQNVDMGVQQPQSCTVSGTIWLDSNWDGNISDGETRVGGSFINVFLAPYFTLSHAIATGTTDANGFYKITVPAEYCDDQVFIQPGATGATSGAFAFWGGESRVNQQYAGWPFTNPVALTGGQDTPNQNVGYRKGGGIEGTICADAGNYVNGGTVTLKSVSSGANVASQTVQNNSFKFNNIPSGRYWVYYWKDSSQYHYDNYWWYLGSGGSWSWDYLSYQNGKTIVEAGTYEFNYTSGSTLTLNGCVKRMTSPISLDLNGNGQIDTSSVADQPDGAAFDLLGTGSPVESGWLADGDGFLVAPSADGTVTSIDNLFGGSLGEGFAKLATYDADGDGQLTGAELDGLGVWVDANGDHQAQADELHALADYGIVSLSVDYVNAPVYNNGNVVIEHATAGLADGSSMVIGDAYFALGHLDAANHRALGRGHADNPAALLSSLRAPAATR